MPSWKRRGPAEAKPEWVKEFTDTIVEQVKKQEAPFQLPWKAGERPQIPRNFATGRPYQGGNTLYLMAVARKRGMEDNRWGTYNQIRAAGGQVRKGEKGVRVVYYKDRGAAVEKDETTRRRPIRRAAWFTETNRRPGAIPSCGRSPCSTWSKPMASTCSRWRSGASPNGRSTGTPNS